MADAITSRIVYFIRISIRCDGRVNRRVYRGSIPFDRGEYDWARQDFDAHMPSGVRHIGFPPIAPDETCVDIPPTATTGRSWAKLEGQEMQMYCMADIVTMARARKIRHFFPPRASDWISVDVLATIAN